MKKITLKTYLRKVQKLQLLAYERGLDCEIIVYQNSDGGWLQGFFGKLPDLYFPFCFYNWQKPEVWDAELARAEEWVNNYAK